MTALLPIDSTYDDLNDQIDKKGMWKIFIKFFTTCNYLFKRAQPKATNYKNSATFRCPNVAFFKG